MLKNPDMKLPAYMASFLKNGSNKENLFNLTERAFIQDKVKLGSKTMFFSITNQCSKITQSEMSIIPDKFIDNEEAHTKLVVLIGNASIQQGHMVMVRSPSGDIDIPVLFLLHQFENTTILIDNGVGKNRKIIDVIFFFLM